jgi:superfamily II DNA or RNA helicase
MKTEFSIRCRNTDALFPVSCLSEFLDKVSELPLGVYVAKEAQKREAFEAICEMFLKKYGEDTFNITDIKPVKIPKTSINFCAKDNEGVPVAIRCIFSNGDEELTGSKDLADFFVDAMLVCGVPPKAARNMIVISNCRAVNEFTLKNFPGADQTIFVLRDSLELLTDNEEFWNDFKIELPYEEDQDYTRTPITRRPHQIVAIEAMHRSEKGGKVISPCGSGKTDIMIEFAVEVSAISTLEKDAANFLVQFPRLSLSSQQTQRFIDGFVSHRIDAQYITFHSADISWDDDYLCKILRANGMPDRKIISFKRGQEDEVAYLIKKYKKDNIPLVCFGTYHSSWALGDIFDYLFRDEGHNIVMGRIDKESRRACCEQKAKKKRFTFTATPVNTIGPKGFGFQNKKYFDDLVYEYEDRRAVNDGEILPFTLNEITIPEYECRKNKKKPKSKENEKEVELDRDPTAMAYGIIEAFKMLREYNIKYSSNSRLIGQKLLVVASSELEKEAILATSELLSFMGEGVRVLAISSAGCFYDNGVIYDGYDYRDKFADALDSLASNEEAIIINIDMIGEGIDCSGFTGAIVFGSLRNEKIVQVVGRPRRLYKGDRIRLYNNEWPDIRTMCRERVMVKPFVHIFVPKFGTDDSLISKFQEIVSDLDRLIGTKPFNFDDNTHPAVEERDVDSNCALNGEKYDMIKLQTDLLAGVERYIMAHGEV